MAQALMWVPVALPARQVICRETRSVNGPLCSCLARGMSGWRINSTTAVTGQWPPSRVDTPEGRSYGRDGHSVDTEPIAEARWVRHSGW